MVTPQLRRRFRGVHTHHVCHQYPQKLLDGGEQRSLYRNISACGRLNHLSKVKMVTVSKLLKREGTIKSLSGTCPGQKNGSSSCTKAINKSAINRTRKNRTKLGSKFKSKWTYHIFSVVLTSFSSTRVVILIKLHNKNSQVEYYCSVLK